MNTNYIDLFCGAGGLSIGLTKAGYKLEFATDIDIDSINTFKYNLNITHPTLNKNNIIHADIKDLYKTLGTSRVYIGNIGSQTITTNRQKKLIKNKKNITSSDLEITSSIKNIDLLCGGPPCQGFSLIGRPKRGTLNERTKGFINDSGNYLFKYFLKFAEKYNPKIILMENVKGLSSASNYQKLILKAISSTGKGYNSNFALLNASDFGIPQNRERLFFIGIRNDVSKKFKIEPQLIFEDILKSTLKTSRITVGEAIYNLPQIKNNPLPSNYHQKNEKSFKNRNSFGMNISDLSYNKLTISNKYSDSINKFKNRTITPDKLYNHKSRYHNNRDKHIYMNLNQGKYLDHPDNFIALNGDGKNFNGVDYIKKTNKNGNKIPTGFSDKYFKLNSNSVSKTIIAHLETDGNSYVHPPIDKYKKNLRYARSITPREAARLQSFPDWYFFTGKLRKQYRQIGNAVPPTLAFEIGKVLKKYFKKINE